MGLTISFENAVFLGPEVVTTLRLFFLIAGKSAFEQSIFMTMCLADV